jgi:hypothetical protein
MSAKQFGGYLHLGGIAADLLLPVSGNSVRSSPAIWNHGGIDVRPVPVFQENLTVYRRKVALGRGLELSGLLLAVSYEAACGLFLV